MFGRGKLEATQIYTQVSIRKLKELHEATHPDRFEREEAEALEMPAEADDAEQRNSSLGGFFDSC